MVEIPPIKTVKWRGVVYSIVLPTLVPGWCFTQFWLHVKNPFWDDNHPRKNGWKNKTFNTSAFLVQKTRPHVRGPTHADNVDRFGTIWDTLLTSDPYPSGKTTTKMTQSPSHFLFKDIAPLYMAIRKRPPRCKAIQLPASDFKSRPML